MSLHDNTATRRGDTPSLEASQPCPVDLLTAIKAGVADTSRPPI